MAEISDDQLWAEYDDVWNGVAGAPAGGSSWLDSLTGLANLGTSIYGKVAGAPSKSSTPNVAKLLSKKNSAGTTLFNFLTSAAGIILVIFLILILAIVWVVIRLARKKG